MGNVKRISALVLALAGLNAQADSSTLENLYYRVEEVKIERVEDTSQWVGLYQLPSDDCSDENQFVTNQTTDFSSLDQIINIGKKIWAVVVANRPVVKVEFNTANALPRGAACWDQLEGWQIPKSEKFQVTYKNLLGLEVVRFSFRLIFTHGGSFMGKGQYITNAAILPAEINVVWGYNFEAGIKVGKLVNLGTRQNPNAGMEMNLEWLVKTPLVDQRQTATFFMTGDGRMIQYK